MRRLSVAVAAAALSITSCEATSGVPVTPFLVIRWSQADFITDLDSGVYEDLDGVIAIGWTGTVPAEVQEDLDQYLADHLRVVSVSRAAVVEGEGRRGFHSVAGSPVVDVVSRTGGAYFSGASFVPVEPLEDGWYVAAIDMREWVAGHRDLHPVGAERVGGHVEDGWSYVRFQMQGDPTWILSSVERDRIVEGRAVNIVGPVLSRPSAIADEFFHLTIDGRPASECTVMTDPTVAQFWWECSTLADNAVVTLTMEPSPGLAALGGATTHTMRAGQQGNPPVPVAPRFGVDLVREVVQ